MGRVSTARERLVQATIDLLWTESYGAVSVDAICEQARVKKGSFYHFFKSKDELVIAALDADWEGASRRSTSCSRRRVRRSSDCAPISRASTERQMELAKKFGRPPGCFYCKLGIEVSQGTEIGKKVQSIMAAYVAYYETRARRRRGRRTALVDIPGKARALFAFMEGVLTQARITDDYEIMKNLGTSAMRFLGLGEVMAA